MKRKIYEITFNTRIIEDTSGKRFHLKKYIFHDYVMITRLIKTDRWQCDYRLVRNLKSQIYGAVFLSMVKDIYEVYARNAIDRLIDRSLPERNDLRVVARAHFSICQPDSEAKLKRGTKSAPRPATRQIPDNAPFVSFPS